MFATIIFKNQNTVNAIRYNIVDPYAAWHIKHFYRGNIKVNRKDMPQHRLQYAMVAKTTSVQESTPHWTISILKVII